jgi:hypothetical protein
MQQSEISIPELTMIQAFGPYSGRGAAPFAPRNARSPDRFTLNFCHCHAPPRVGLVQSVNQTTRQRVQCKGLDLQADTLLYRVRSLAHDERGHNRRRLRDQSPCTYPASY